METAMAIKDIGNNRPAYDALGAQQDLRAKFRQDPQAGLKAAAQQFEALFMQMVMKGMRDTVPQDGLFHSEQTRFYTSLLDQQMAQNMATSGRGVGFASMIEKQLGRYLQNAGGDSVEQQTRELLRTSETSLPLQIPDARYGLGVDVGRASWPAPSDEDDASSGNANVVEGSETRGNSKDFVTRVWPHAVEASRNTGIPPQFLVGHAALESGWGKGEIRRADGSPSYNLFGIKAGKNWDGATAETMTTEYINGQPRKLVQTFRAYGSYAESFQDYAKLLRSNPRYGGVIGSQDGMEFAKRLQQAGYATDPAYAEKLGRIINGPTLRQALVG